MGRSGNGTDFARLSARIHNLSKIPTGSSQAGPGLRLSYRCASCTLLSHARMRCLVWCFPRLTGKAQDERLRSGSETLSDFEIGPWRKDKSGGRNPLDEDEIFTEWRASTGHVEPVRGVRCLGNRQGFYATAGRGVAVVPVTACFERDAQLSAVTALPVHAGSQVFRNTAAGARTHRRWSASRLTMGPVSAAGTAGPELWKSTSGTNNGERQPGRSYLPRFSLFSPVNIG